MAKDYTNVRVGRGIGLYPTEGHSGKNIIWAMLCDCGILYPANTGSLGNAHTRSCGCLRRDVTISRSTTHGMRATHFYAVWSGMIQRCTNPMEDRHEAYYHRGIKVCKRWLIFENFRDDMQESYRTLQKKGHHPSIERIGVNGNYELSNCCWIPVEQQAANRRNSKLDMEDIKTIRFIKKNCPLLTQRDIAEIFDISDSHISHILSGDIWSWVKQG